MSKRPLGIMFFPEDWTKLIQSLPPLEFGVLVRLALQSIDSIEPGTLPNNDRTLAFRAGLAVDDWAALRPALSEFMEVAGETVRFPTIKRRYDSAAAFRRQQADHARKRWDGSHMPPSCHPHATHERPMSDPHASAFCVPVPVLKERPEEPPNPPAGGLVVDSGSASPTPKANRKAPAESVPIPTAIDTEAFRAKWADWLADRRERRNAVTARAARGQLARLKAMGPVRAIASIQQSIDNGWSGIFPPRSNQPANPQQQPQQQPLKIKYGAW